MTATTTKIDLGNNEEIRRGIFAERDGTFTAMTFTTSKNFITLKGAQRWMERRLNLYAHTPLNKIRGIDDDMCQHDAYYGD